MTGGFFALLDDIATLAKAAVASLDDVAAGALKASAKSAGVVIDDTAVTPQYMQGLSPRRELPVIWRISRGSIINKFVIIIPSAMLLSVFAPQVLPVLLLIGGTYLCFEGAMKVANWLGWVTPHHPSMDGHRDSPGDVRLVEGRIVRSAITTDLVLSTEIMLIAMSNIEEPNVVSRLLILVVVAVAMTVFVYGLVAILVKLDDVGLHLAGSKSPRLARFGVGLARAMPSAFQVIGIIGTVAMLWVGGHLLVASLHDLGFDLLYRIAHAVADFGALGGAVGAWLGDTLVSEAVGLLFGGVLVAALQVLKRLLRAVTSKL